jgi:DNA-binding XRE family transcriptional regulator
MEGDDGRFWGGLIRMLRCEQYVSQRQLAERAGINRATLRRIEDGIVKGDFIVVARSLKLLGYDLEAYCEASLDERLRRAAAIEADPVKRSRLAYRRLLVMLPQGQYLNSDSILVSL